jgi:hypothetical protein
MEGERVVVVSRRRQPLTPPGCYRSQSDRPPARLLVPLARLRVGPVSPGLLPPVCVQAGRGRAAGIEAGRRLAPRPSAPRAQLAAPGILMEDDMPGGSGFGKEISG